MRRVLTTGLALLLTGCLEYPYEGTVSRVQTLSDHHRQSFVIEPFTAGADRQPIFAATAADVARRMIAHGYHLAPPGTASDLVVKLGYRVGPEYLAIDRRIVAQGNQYRGGGSHVDSVVVSRQVVSDSNGGTSLQTQSVDTVVDDPVIDYGPADPYRLIHDSELLIEIDQRDTGTKVFTGTVRAQTHDATPDYIIPAMTRAMFAGFPGASGAKVKIGFWR